MAERVGAAGAGLVNIWTMQIRRRWGGLQASAGAVVGEQRRLAGSTRRARRWRRVEALRVEGGRGGLAGGGGDGRTSRAQSQAQLHAP